MESSARDTSCFDVESNNSADTSSTVEQSHSKDPPEMLDFNNDSEWPELGLTIPYCYDSLYPRNR